MILGGAAISSTPIGGIMPSAGGGAVRYITIGNATSQPAASGAAITTITTSYITIGNATSQPAASGAAITKYPLPFIMPRPEKAGYQVAPYAQTIRTEMETGNQRVRRRSSARNDVVSLQWKMTDTEFASFRTWFDSSGGAAGGASWFSIDLAVGNVGVDIVEARFVGEWAADMLPGLHWRVSAKIEVR